MSSRYPHNCVITRPGEDTRDIDPESGQPMGAEPGAEAVYQGKCYYDERGSAVMREKGGDTDIEGKGVLKLPKEAAVFDQETDSVAITANGIQFSGRITETRYFRRDIHLLVTPDTKPVAA